MFSQVSWLVQMFSQRTCVGLVMLGLCWFGLCLAVQGDDWPQWRGPQRDGVSREVGLRQDWRSSPPRLLWRAEGIGGGYSSIVVSRGHVYTIGRRGQQVVCTCLAEATGALRWSRQIDRTERMPSSTPTVDGDRIYLLDPDGDLYCLAAGTGESLWHRSYLSDLDGQMMSSRGFAESPLVDGDRLICTPGSPQTTLAALDKFTGELVWTASVPKLGEAGRDGAGFASPVVSTAAGVRQYVQLVGRGLVGVRAADGKFLWGYNSLANQTANIPTPIAEGDFIFAANGYNTGSVLLRLSPEVGGVAARPVYKLSGSRFQNHHGGVTLVDGHIFGGHGSNNGLPTCLQLASGKVRWKRRGPGVGSASLVYADRRLYLRYQNGLVALIRATPQRYELLGTFQLPGAGGDSWSHPVVANGRLLLREQNRLFAYDIRCGSEPEQRTAEPAGDQSLAALQRQYTTDPMFRYASNDSNGPLTVRRILAAEITSAGDLTPAAIDRLGLLEGNLIVDAAGLPLGDSGLTQLGRLDELCGLNLELCLEITDRGIQQLQRAVALRVIRLTGTAITDEGLRPLAKLPQLQALDLEVCEQITDAGCQWLGRMHQLKGLILKKSGFEVQRITPAGLAQLSELKQLESLNLYGNLLDDDSLAALGQLTNLRELDLSLNAISDQGLAHLQALRDLERLDLLFSVGFAGPQVTNAGAELLARHRRLRTLNLVGALITDDGLRLLAQLRQLETLHLVRAQVSNAAVKRLQEQLPGCEIRR